jgi:hypothetical protein
VEREYGIVALRAHQVHAGLDQVQAHGKAQGCTRKEKGDRGEQIENADPFMVGREEPPADAGIGAGSCVEGINHNIHLVAAGFSLRYMIAFTI